MGRVEAFKRLYILKLVCLTLLLHPDESRHSVTVRVYGTGWAESTRQRTTPYFPVYYLPPPPNSRALPCCTPNYSPQPGVLATQTRKERREKRET